MENLTKTQAKFLKKGRTMKEIATKLFKNDYWAANRFQNTFINNKVLEVYTTNTENTLIRIKPLNN